VFERFGIFYSTFSYSMGEKRKKRLKTSNLSHIVDKYIQREAAEGGGGVMRTMRTKVL